MELSLFKTLTKYPFGDEDSFYDSHELKQNKTCEKCKAKDCRILLKQVESGSEYICSQGYNNKLFIMGKLRVFLNGLIFHDNTAVPQGRKAVRQDWFVERSAVELFGNKLKEIENHIVTEIQKTTEQNFSMFHDFKTSMTIFFNCTQDIINNLPGETFQQKLDNSEASYRDLYNALQLITSQLSMVDVILNPQRIVFGNKRTVNLYRLFEKIKILFTHLSNKKRDINVTLVSEGWIDDSLCYESIEFIPLILLDNALKYSMRDTDIEIKFEQYRTNVKVMVKSIGPFVAEENKEKIFEKFFRDESGQEFAKDGMGMGLWIAQQILKAHGSKIVYHRDSKETRTRGLNIFEFNLPTFR